MRTVGWEKLFVDPMSDKRLISKYGRSLTAKNPIKNGSHSGGIFVLYWWGWCNGRGRKLYP